MNRSITILAVLAALAGNLTRSGMAGDMKHEHAAVAATSALDPLKSLEGEWTGKAGTKGQEMQDATVIYRVTANGTVVMETLFSGTPHEMVTMYTADGNRIALAHYCSMGNQPRMVSRARGASNELAFEFVPTPGIDARKDMHMHGAKLTIVDPDHLRSEWTQFDKGKVANVMMFEFARKK